MRQDKAVNVSQVLIEFAHERGRQDKKWGEQNHDPLYWLSILIEEVGEVGKALCENDAENYREELIQVGAVACSMIESLDRNGFTLLGPMAEKKTTRRGKHE